MQNTISMGTEDFKQATVADDKPYVCKLDYGTASESLRLKNARALALATRAAIEGLRKKKAKGGKSRSKSSSKTRRSTVSKRKRGKKQIHNNEKSRLQALFDKFDKDKSKTIGA